MERDDIIEYSLHAHHSEEEGKKIRKKIFFVTALLSIITAVEVAMDPRNVLLPMDWDQCRPTDGSPSHSNFRSLMLAG